MIKAIIFDFDDTLEDFKTAKLFAHQAIAKYLLKGYGLPVKKFLKIFPTIDYGYTIKGKASSPRLFKRELWFEEAFKRLKIKSTKKEVKALTKKYWEHVFKHDTGINKPHKSLYNLIFKKLKVKADECVMVGDKPYADLRLAKQLGLETVWFRYGPWAARVKKKPWYVDYSIKDIKDLLKIV